MKTIKTDLNLHPQAWAVVHLLAGFEFTTPAQRPNLVDIETSALYNGRERGIVVTAKDYETNRKFLHVFFAESRNSDQIMVVHWYSDGNVNPPDHIPQYVWDDRTARNYFGYADTMRVAELVRDMVQNYLNGRD